MPRLPRNQHPLPPPPYPQPDPAPWKPLGLRLFLQPLEYTVSLRPLKPSKQARNQRNQGQHQPQAMRAQEPKAARQPRRLWEVVNQRLG